MSLVSPGFFLFLLVTLAVYFFAPKNFRWIVLLAGSCSFYLIMGGWESLLAVNLAATVIWFTGMRLGEMRGRRESKNRLRVPLAIGLVILFGGLAAVSAVKNYGILALAGVSYYVFQSAGYLIDIYAGKVQPERSFFKLALFLSFFPQLVQGPIARHGQVASELYAGHGWDWDRSRHGVQRIIWGYFLKLAVADRCAVLVNTVFGSPESYGGFIALFALFMYTVQVFGDFAGGISIMVGIGEIVGVKLPENFRQPFLAVSVSDFWRRWHITLGTWLKDYLFYPIALSKPIGKLGIRARKIFGVRAGKLIPATAATFAVYFIMGIWHGATWQGFAFGILNGLIISASQFAEPLFERVRVSLFSRRKIDGGKAAYEASALWRWLAVARTFIIMLLLRVFVRAASLSAALAMLKSIVLNFRPAEILNGTILSLGLSKADYLVLGFGMAAILAAEILGERFGDIFKLTGKAPTLVQSAGLLFMLGFITIFGLYTGNAASAAFIYGQF